MTIKNLLILFFVILIVGVALAGEIFAYAPSNIIEAKEQSAHKRTIKETQFDDGSIYKPAHPDEKWIEVNLVKQTVTAWEGNRAVMHFIVSTGLPRTPTVQGTFRIETKYAKKGMSGPGYYLPGVPYTMFFYSGYALHGTYWHNKFGQPMSHGCVNLKTPESEMLFHWADPVLPTGKRFVESSEKNLGTVVVVHKGTSDDLSPQIAAGPDTQITISKNISGSISSVNYQRLGDFIRYLDGRPNFYLE